MFFKDQDNAQAVLFGEKPVVVANFTAKDEKGMMAGVLIGEGIKNKIVTRDNNQGKDSGEIRTKIRLVFQDMASVDNVINALKRVRQTFFEEEAKTMLKEDQPLKPEEN